LMKLIFEEADPKPQVLRLTFGFDNLTRPVGPATLSSAPEGRTRFPGDTLGVRRGRVFRFIELVELGDFDPERIFYLLMADIYNGFGYEALSVPYINMNDQKPKLQASAIVGNDLPTTVATPDL